MKKCITMLVLTVMAFAVMCSPVLAAEPENFNCNVTAEADREFTFVYPADITIAYKDTSAEIGYIGMKNLFLYPDEKLIITITTEPMVHDDRKTKLPYTVKYKGLPSKIDIDGMWPVTMKIGSGVWKNAKAGDYLGKINFTVTSSLTGETLLRKTTTIRASVPASGVDIKELVQPYGFVNLNLPKTGDTDEKSFYNSLLATSLVMLGFFILMKKKQDKIS